MVDWIKEARNCTDAQWHALTKRYGHGYCGGCGEDSCHVGQECIDDENGWCKYCPDRIEIKVANDDS